MHPEKKFFMFREWNFFALILQIFRKQNPRKKILIFEEMETLKGFLIFSQKKPVLVFPETETLIKFLIFRETELSYISGNRDFKKLLIFQEVTFRALKSNFFILFPINKQNFLN